MNVVSPAITPIYALLSRHNVSLSVIGTKGWRTWNRRWLDRFAEKGFRATGHWVDTSDPDALEWLAGLYGHRRLQHREESIRRFDRLGDVTRDYLCFVHGFGGQGELIQFRGNLPPAEDIQSLCLVDNHRKSKFTPKVWRNYIIADLDMKYAFMFWHGILSPWLVQSE